MSQLSLLLPPHSTTSTLKYLRILLTAWLELFDQGVELHFESRQSRIRGDVNKPWSGPPPLIRRGAPRMS